MRFDTGVYAITNLANGHRYIGSAVSFKKRWREHRRQLTEGRHHSQYLQRAWNKYGPGSFDFRPVLFCDKENLIGYEQAAMDTHSPEYNIAPVAGSQLGYRHSQETLAKLRAARARNGFSPMRGRKHSEESRRKISENRKGKGGGKRTQELKDKISAALKGREITAEHRRRIAEKLRGRKQSQETIEKRASKLRGRKMPDGFADAQRKRMLGKELSPETKQRIARAKSKLLDADVIAVRKLLGHGLSHRSISSITGVSRWTVAEISCGRNYGWVS